MNPLKVKNIKILKKLGLKDTADKIQEIIDTLQNHVKIPDYSEQNDTNGKILLQVLQEIERMEDTNEDVWTGHEVRKHLTDFILTKI